MSVAPTTETRPDEVSEDPLLDVVIVTDAGGRDLVRACLSSLERNPLTTGQMAVHLVDNASGDGTVEAVRAEFPSVLLHPLEWNAGFCYANNLVLRQTSGPFALVLNPDTELAAGVLDHMVELMRLRPEIGVASCRLVKKDGTFDHAAKRSFPTPLGAFAQFSGLARSPVAGRRLRQYLAPGVGEHEAGEVDAVNGAFMLVRRAAMDQVGLFDERYWLYMEDLDWCYRFKQHGWKVWYEGGATAIHVKGGTTVKRGRHRALKQNVAFHRGMGRFYRKFYGGRNPLLDGLIYLAIGVKLAISASRSAVARRGFR
jgi:GT2 family glycosyltransferase